MATARRSGTRNFFTAGSAVLIAAAMAGCTTGQSEPTTASGPPSPTADAAAAVPLSQVPADSPLDPGRYVVSIADAPSAPLLPVLSVPEGFEGIEDAIGVRTEDFTRYLWVWDVDSVYTHPCDASPEPVGPSVADLANALAAQPLRAGTDPVAVTVGGYDGLYVELSVPDDVDVSACPSSVFSLWPGRAQRFQEILGQVDMVWIVDVDGQRITFDASHMPNVSSDKVAELKEMVTTATFAPSEGTENSQ
jgi:hypothetical protein